MKFSNCQIQINCFFYTLLYQSFYFEIRMSSYDNNTYSHYQVSTGIQGLASMYKISRKFTVHLCDNSNVKKYHISVSEWYSLLVLATAIFGRA